MRDTYGNVSSVMGFIPEDWYQEELVYGSLTDGTSVKSLSDVGL